MTVLKPGGLALELDTAQPVTPMSVVGFWEALWYVGGPQFAAQSYADTNDVDPWPAEDIHQQVDLVQYLTEGVPKYAASDPILSKPAIDCTTNSWKLEGTLDETAFGTDPWWVTSIAWNGQVGTSGYKYLWAASDDGDSNKSFVQSGHDSSAFVFGFGAGGANAPSTGDTNDHLDDQPLLIVAQATGTGKTIDSELWVNEAHVIDVPTPASTCYRPNDFRCPGTVDHASRGWLGYIAMTGISRSNPRSQPWWSGFVAWVESEHGTLHKGNP